LLCIKPNNNGDIEGRYCLRPAVACEKPTPIDEEGSEAISRLLPNHALAKVGDDTIFAWLARCRIASKQGQKVINGTVGSLLENDGSLAVNKMVANVLREQTDIDLAAYAPLLGLPRIREIAPKLSLGEEVASLKEAGIQVETICTPGGTGGLYLTIRNLLEPGDALLLRDCHWGPYRTIAEECNATITTWPILAEDGASLATDELEDTLKDLLACQPRVLTWLNDPAHNPTGLSLDSKGRESILLTLAEAARSHPEQSVSLILDGAYQAYATEPHGWGETLAKFAKSTEEWPENFLVCTAFSASKSHTMYGQRFGALVMIHPSAAVLSRLLEVMLHTGRGTWSGANRLAQSTVHAIQSDPEKKKQWALERDRMKRLLQRRRRNFNQHAERQNVPIFPNHDGYFAFLPCQDPESIAEYCASKGLYIVPLEGGVRIGLCSIPEDKIEETTRILAGAWQNIGT